MLWLFEKVKKHQKYLSEHLRCSRCGMYYKKTLATCNRCEGIPDSELRILLENRAKNRVGIGKMMLVGAVVIFVLLLVFNS